MIYGYARVSSVGQSLEVQLAALKAAGCETIRAEKMSGTTRQGRKELERLMAEIRAGDVLTITRIDRLARSISDLLNIVAELHKRGAALRSTEQPVDATTPTGRAFLQMLGVFAELENSMRAERQKAGIARAKSEGVYDGVGRPVSIDAEEVRALVAAGNSKAEAARLMGISRASVYRVLETP